MTESKEQKPFWVNSTEMDFITAIEADCPIPIAFKDRSALDRWVDNETGLKRFALGRRDDEADVLLLHGLIYPGEFTKENPGQGLHYKQVWVRVDYDYYRDALKFAIEKSEGSVAVKLYDGDHSVGQDRLKKLWPKAWVNMVLVERRVNRAIGSMLEKEPLYEPEDMLNPDRILINAESILKTFFVRGDQTMELSRVRDYLDEARQRFIIFRNRTNVAEESIEAGSEERLNELAMSENAWGFFDDFARALGVDPLVRPPTPKLRFTLRE